MTSQKELVALWIAAGYRKSMASATITPPPPKAFRRVYHMMKSKWALVAIDDQRLKVSRIEDLNDPFELLGMNRHTQASRKVSKRFRAAFSESQGLLCFGADWSNSVMWSHYSEKHKGICLGFDVRRGMLQEVQYEDRRLRVALGDSADPPSLGPKLQHQLTCTKAKAWSYEEEFRRFIDLRSVRPLQANHRSFAQSAIKRMLVPAATDPLLRAVCPGERHGRRSTPVSRNAVELDAGDQHL